MTEMCQALVEVNRIHQGYLKGYDGCRRGYFSPIYVGKCISFICVALQMGIFVRGHFGTIVSRFVMLQIGVKFGCNGKCHYNNEFRFFIKVKQYMLTRFTCKINRINQHAYFLMMVVHTILMIMRIEKTQFALKHAGKMIKINSDKYYNK